MIEIIGTSPVTMGLAPYKGEIWTLNHEFTIYKKTDRHFDFHKNTVINFDTNCPYHIFLQSIKDKAWVCEPEKDKELFFESLSTYLPDANLYPIQKAKDMFGNYFKSTIDYLIALAIIEDRKQIGLYGIDLADSVERWEQRRSLEHKIGYAQAKGINIIIPSESPILKSSHMYGIEDEPEVFKYLKAKRNELSARLLNAPSKEARNCLIGALQNVESLLNNW
jgi:hypothetical protein